MVAFLLPIAFGTFYQHHPLITLLRSDAFSVTFGSITLSAYTALKILFTFFILLWVTFAIISFTTHRIKNLSYVSASNRELILKILQIVIYFFAFMIGLDILGIDFKALAVFGGAVGIGIGFGLQKITSNFISGIILLMEKSVEVGDLIEIDNGTYGYLRHTNARYTLIETFDGKEIMIPNEDFITNRVSNWTFTHRKARIEIPVHVSYQSDLEQVKKLILEAAKEHPQCLIDPAPECFLREFGDYAVKFLLYFWIRDVTQGRFNPQSDILFSIWKKFKKHGIEIPYPQQEISIKNKTPSLKKAPAKKKKRKNGK